jgi:hypothetical protein
LLSPSVVVQPSDQARPALRRAVGILMAAPVPKVKNGAASPHKNVRSWPQRMAITRRMTLNSGQPERRRQYGAS